MNLFVGQVAAKTADKVTETPSELTNLLASLLSNIPLWIAAGVLLILTFLLAKIVRSAVENKIVEKGIEEEHKEIPILAGRSSYAAVLTIGITASLKVAGIDITSIIAAVAFGLGFALKDLIMNFIAGIMILMARQFTIGDFIQVGNTKGKIIEIQSRATVLKSFDGTKIIVPNGQLFTDQVTSYTSNPFRRIEAEVGVDYRSNLENALKLCMKIALETPGVLAQPKPVVMVTEWGDSDIVIKVRAWVESRAGWLRIRSDLYRNLKKAYDEYNINLAWNVTQLIMDKDIQNGLVEKMVDEEPSSTAATVAIAASNNDPANNSTAAAPAPPTDPAKMASLIKETEEMDQMDH